MNVTKETIIRTIVLVIALANQILAYLGKEMFPITEEEVYQYGSVILTVAASVWAWWKNNSFSGAAVQGDRVTKGIKSIIEK